MPTALQIDPLCVKYLIRQRVPVVPDAYQTSATFRAYTVTDKPEVRDHGFAALAAQLYLPVHSIIAGYVC